MDTINIQQSQYSQIISPSGGMNSSAAPNKTANFIVQSNASNTSFLSTDEVPSILQGINYIQHQLKDYIYSDPPFFPAGHPQRPALIKRIKGLQEDIKVSSIEPTIKKMVSPSNTLPPNATDIEVSKALDNLYKLRETLNDNHQLSTEPAKPGSLLNIKV